ncbi:MAG: L-2-amino-thiazoline-4-carboxylic acid hydrolase [Thermodesulfobacteriota bacterium]
MAVDLSQISILARREIEARILGPILKAFIQEFGRERTIKMVAAIIESIAKETGAQLAKTLGDNSLEAYARGHSLWTKEDALQMEILEQSPKKFYFNVTRCRYAEMYKELGIPEFGYLLSCGRDAALMAGFNPQVKLMRTRTIMDGAPYCDFRYEVQE